MSDRFPRIETARSNPGVCFLCSSPVGPFVDTGRTEQLWGVVVICYSCVREMAHSFGLEDEAQRFFDQRVLQSINDLPTLAKELRSDFSSRLEHLCSAADGLARTIERSARQLDEAVALRERETSGAGGGPNSEDDADPAYDDFSSLVSSSTGKSKRS